MQLLAFLLDGAFVGQFAQQPLEVGARRVLQAESAGDFAGADLARWLPMKARSSALEGREGVRLGGLFNS